MDRWRTDALAVPAEAIMRVAVAWDGRGADKIGEVMAKIVAKYPNAVFLVPEHWNGAHHGLVIGNTVELGACAVTFHLNRKKLDEQAFETACLRACIEGGAEQVVIVGDVPEMEAAARHWNLSMWKVEVPTEAPPSDDVPAEPKPEGVA